VSNSYAERLSCPGCARKFRDTDSLVRHLSRNLEHGTRRRWLGDWVVREHTVETFRRLPGTPDGQSIQVHHDAASNTIRVEGATETTVDTAPVADRITGDVEYDLRGPYLLVRFRRTPRQTC
jgi:hypothetical protein